MSKQKIYDYLNKHRLMTLATASVDGKPEAATVEYVMDGDDLLLNTYVHYRKYENIRSNPRVACVVTENEDYTLQFDATIQELSGEEAQAAKNKMLAKEPGYANYFNDEKTRFFRITPYWMRLRDYTGSEVNEFLWK